TRATQITVCDPYHPADLSALSPRPGQAQLKTVPRWYWPVAFLPGLIFALLFAARWRAHGSEHGRNILEPEKIGMAFAAYAAFVLLGYLLFLCASDRPKGLRERVKSEL